MSVTITKKEFADKTSTQEGLDLKQNITDVNLTTTNKTIVGAINELNGKHLYKHTITIDFRNQESVDPFWSDKYLKVSNELDRGKIRIYVLNNVSTQYTTWNESVMKNAMSFIGSVDVYIKGETGGRHLEAIPCGYGSQTREFRFATTIINPSDTSHVFYRFYLIAKTTIIEDVVEQII